MRIKTLLPAVALTFFLISCEKDVIPDNASEKDNRLSGIADCFLENTVYPTYKALADCTEELHDQLGNISSQSDLDRAAETFLEARRWWELSEAFLFGAASDFGIDPHIDSWPLDIDGFKDLMNSPAILDRLAAEDGDVYAGSKLGNDLLGFHGIEYILFDPSGIKKAKAWTAISPSEYAYSVAVSGDLRNRTAQLDAAWRGEAAGDRLAMVEDELELPVTVGGGDFHYGENLLSAGQPGSTFRSWTHAAQSILQAAADIADEVGTSKIGKAHTGEDVTYIESPYSKNSIADFYDNIISIQNVYYGGIESLRDESRSFHAFFLEYDSDIDREIVSAIDEALQAVSGMKSPFVDNISDPSCDVAMAKCAALVDVLENAIKQIPLL
ncbi:MAG: imelysin family protein [Candidatus Cryptobacteroides sp.]